MNNILDPVAPDTSYPVAPPTDSLKADFESARSTGNPQDLYSLLPRAVGTAIAPRIVQNANVMAQQNAPVEAVLNQVDKKGGIQTQEGRLAAVDTFTKMQPEVGIGKAIVQALSGNKDWRFSLNQGNIRPKRIYDSNGNEATAYMAENSDLPIRVIDAATGNDLTTQEFDKRGFGKYTSFENNPGIQQNKIKAEKAATQYIADLHSANITDAVASTIGNQSDTIFGILGSIKANNKGLTNNEMNDLYKYTSRGQTIGSSISSALNELKQATNAESKSKALENVNTLVGKAGVPAIAGISLDNKIANKDGTTTSLSDFLQKVGSTSSSNTSEQTFAQNYETLKKSNVYQKLSASEKQMMDIAMNLQQSNERLKATHADTFSSNPILGQSIPYDIGQPLGVGMANALVDKMNAEISNIYKKKMDEAGKGGAIPDPGSVQAAVNRLPEVIDIRAKYLKEIGKIQSAQAAPENIVANTTEQNPTVKKSQPKSIFSPEQTGRLDNAGSTRPSKPAEPPESQKRLTLEEIAAKHRSK